MRDLWGDRVRRCGDYCVFHDESEPGKRWLLIGLLFVQTLHLDEVRAVLRYVRRTENCLSEIHFSALPKSFGGEGGAKARVARQWLRCYQNRSTTALSFPCWRWNGLARGMSASVLPRIITPIIALRRWRSRPASPGISALNDGMSCPFISSRMQRIEPAGLIEG